MIREDRVQREWSGLDLSGGPSDGRRVDRRDPPAVSAREFLGRRHRVRLAWAAHRAAHRRPTNGPPSPRFTAPAPPRRKPPAPAVPAPEPLPVRPAGGGFEVAGLARVGGSPHRCRAEARRIAERVAARPLAYTSLAVLMPGVDDLRPHDGEGVGHG